MTNCGAHCLGASCPVFFFFFFVVSALMCFDPWVWELPSLTLLRDMALTFHTLPYLIIPTHSFRTLSLTLFHPNDFFPCPRLPNNTYPPLLYPMTTEILKSKSVRSTDDVIGICVRQSQIVTKTNDSSFSYRSVSEIDYLSNTVVFELLNWPEAYMGGGKGQNVFVSLTLNF